MIALSDAERSMRPSSPRETFPRTMYPLRPSAMVTGMTTFMSVLTFLSISACAWSVWLPMSSFTRWIIPS